MTKASISIADALKTTIQETASIKLGFDDRSKLEKMIGLQKALDDALENSYGNYINEMEPVKEQLRSWTKFSGPELEKWLQSSVNSPELRQAVGDVRTSLAKTLSSFDALISRVSSTDERAVKAYLGNDLDALQAAYADAIPITQDLAKLRVTASYLTRAIVLADGFISK